MAELNASFIPKKDIKSKRASPSFSVNIFLLIAVIIFLTSVFGSLGVYVWKNRLTQLKDSALKELNDNRESFGLASIQEQIELSNRINAVDTILDNHIDITRVFTVLERDTLTEVTISGFSFDTTSDGMILVTGKGTAPSYEHVAYQAEIYGNNKDIKDLLLSEVDQDRDNTVTFNIEFAIDKSFLLLRN